MVNHTRHHQVLIFINQSWLMLIDIEHMNQHPHPLPTISLISGNWIRLWHQQRMWTWNLTNVVGFNAESMISGSKGPSFVKVGIIHSFWNEIQIENTTDCTNCAIYYREFWLNPECSVYVYIKAKAWLGHTVDNITEK